MFGCVSCLSVIHVRIMNTRVQKASVYCILWTKRNITNCLHVHLNLLRRLKISRLHSKVFDHDLDGAEPQVQQRAITGWMDHLNNNDSLVVSDSDVSVNKHSGQVSDQCGSSFATKLPSPISMMKLFRCHLKFLLVPVHVGHKRFQLGDGHGVVHCSGVAPVGGRRHPQGHIHLKVKDLVGSLCNSFVILLGSLNCYEEKRENARM